MCAISDLTYQFGGPYSKVVDVFDSATGTWSIMSLSVARSSLAAAAIGSVAIFAGGLIECKLILMKRRNSERERGFYVACSYEPLFVRDLGPLRNLAVILHVYLQTVVLLALLLMPWTCTIVPQGFGPLQSL
jgi:hypothetical protein